MYQLTKGKLQDKSQTILHLLLSYENPSSSFSFFVRPIIISYEFNIFLVIEFECPIWNNNHKIIYEVHSTSGWFIALYSRCACVCTHRYIFRRTQMQRNVKIYSVWFIVNQLSELRMCWKHIIFTFYYRT